MNSVLVLILAAIVFFVGYRFYAKTIDTKVIKADPKKSHSGYDVYGWSGIHAYEQEHPLWLPV